MLLATDLDGTFLGGSVQHREQLYRLIKNDPSITLVFVTGRGLESILPLFADADMPRPHYIICDVGATVIHGDDLNPVEPLQASIKKRWPGTSTVLQHFKDITWLEYQQVPQQRRCSFFLRNEAYVGQAMEMADEINCDVIYSAGKFLDILPRGVNKGSTLTNLVGQLHLPYENVLVAGDTLNDLSMYQQGFKGVAVGASESGLLNATKNTARILHAEAAGAGGILEAIEFFKIGVHVPSKVA